MLETTVRQKPVREKRTREIEVGDLARLVGRASRFLSELSSMPPFERAEIGLGEWVALSTLAEKDGIGDRRLAKKLGVSSQRANQITTSLSSANLIVISPSPEDSSKKVISLTEAGRNVVSRLNGTVTPLVAEALKGNEKSLTKLNKSFRAMMHLVKPARAEKANRTAKGRDTGSR